MCSFTNTWKVINRKILFKALIEPIHPICEAFKWAKIVLVMFHNKVLKGKKKELIIKVDSKYYRPLEIDYLKGNPKKAFRELKYKLKHNLKDLVKDMLDSDISILKKNK